MADVAVRLGLGLLVLGLVTFWVAFIIWATGWLVYGAMIVGLWVRERARDRLV